LSHLSADMGIVGIPAFASRPARVKFDAAQALNSDYAKIGRVISLTNNSRNREEFHQPDMNTRFPTSNTQLFTLKLSGCLVIALILFMGCILPWTLVDLARTALENLHLSTPMAIFVLIGMLFGSVINIPIYKIPTQKEVVVRVLEPVGGWSIYPQADRTQHEMIIAVNVGGCVIPVTLGVWLLPYLWEAGPDILFTLVIGILLNSAISYSLAKPIPGIGIALPVFIPTLVALSVAWFALGSDKWNDVRAPVAYLVGIAGPLLGADLLHWRDFRNVASGIISIGGAGTWDGIVLCGLLSALLA